MIVPSYASEQKVSPIKYGRIGIMTLDTIASMIFWNSSRKEEIRLAFVHARCKSQHNGQYKCTHDRHYLWNGKFKNYIRQSFEMTGSGAEGQMWDQQDIRIMQRIKQLPREEA